MVKNMPANAEDVRDAGSIPGSGRSPGGGRGNPLQYSCLESGRSGGGDVPWRRTWKPTPVFLPEESHIQRRATVYGVAKSWTQLSD